MSRKYLLLLIFVILISVSAVSAADNSTDQVMLDENVSVESVNSVDEPTSTDYYDYYEDEYYEDDYYDDWDDEDYYYEKAILKPTKLTTTYNSGKTFNVKAVSSHDKSYRLSDVKLKLTVYTKKGHKNYYAYTNYNGIAKFKVSKLSLGKHKVVVSSADYYTSAKKVTSYVKINKVKTKVSAPKVTTKYKKSKTFKIKIKDKANNKAVKRLKYLLKWVRKNIH